MRPSIYTYIFINIIHKATNRHYDIIVHPVMCLSAVSSLQTNTYLAVQSLYNDNILSKEL